jgi:type II secretory pathway component PulJ
MRRSVARRAGKSLIEMLVVIITMSAILTVASQMLYRLSRAERMVRESGPIARAEVRFFRTFRSDARAANQARLEEQNGRMQLTLVSHAHTVTYRSTGDAVIRTLQDDRGPRQDAYRLGPSDINFQVENDRFAVARATPRRQVPGRAKGAAGAFEIVAALGTGESPVQRQRTPKRAALNDTAKTNGDRPVEAARPNKEAAP